MSSVQPINVIEIKRISPNRFEDVILFLRHNFGDEPLSQAERGDKHPGVPNIYMEKLRMIYLQNGLSVMAVTKDNHIAGVAINIILKPGDMDAGMESLAHISDGSLKKILHLKYSTNIKLNLFNRFDGVGRMFEFRSLSVKPEFRGHGLATKMLRFSEQIAIENGFKMLKMHASSLYSQKTALSVGMEAISEMRYDSLTFDDGTMKFNVDPPHEYYSVYVKILKTEANDE